MKRLFSPILFTAVFAAQPLAAQTPPTQGWPANRPPDQSAPAAKPPQTTQTPPAAKPQATTPAVPSAPPAQQAVGTPPAVPLPQLDPFQQPVQHTWVWQVPGTPPSTGGQGSLSLTSK